ncbi:MAG TPA: TetR/AcrR family transcriptional regulator [Actinocrinis sp.]|nr:TetR/AcrR family transcriptional regulator [Actinocrinis sp.]
MFDVTDLPPSPWGKKPRAAKAESKPALTRPAIVDAALRIIDAEGMDAVSMRRIAQDLGTGAASLYAHVADKEELMDLVVDQIMGEIVVNFGDQDPGAGAGWVEWVKAMARTMLVTLLAHGDVAKAFVGRIPFGPQGLVAMEAHLAVLREAGLPDFLSTFVGDLISQFVTGYVLDEVGWRGRFPGAEESDLVEHLTKLRDYLKSLPVDRFPNLVEMAGMLLSGEDDGLSRFELGLEVIVRGFASFVTPQQPPQDPPAQSA